MIILMITLNVSLLSKRAWNNMEKSGVFIIIITLQAILIA